MEAEGADTLLGKSTQSTPSGGRHRHDRQHHEKHHEKHMNGSETDKSGRPSSADRPGIVRPPALC
jgi:hypothetical protein